MLLLFWQTQVFTLPNRSVSYFGFRTLDIVSNFGFRVSDFEFLLNTDLSFRRNIDGALDAGIGFGLNDWIYGS